jgi:predicted MFS family arabinose efflux permease
MIDEETTADKSFKRTLLLPTLLLCVFLAFSVNVFFQTLLVNVASSFNVPIGTASQLLTIGVLAVLIMSFAMSALAIRFKHKSLFLFGVVLYAVGVLVYFFALNFATWILAQILLGTSMPMILIMVYTLIGEQFPLERRGWAMGLLASTSLASAVVVGPISGVIAGVAGWRMVLLGFIFPVSIICLALAYVTVPSKQPQPQANAKPSYTQALKKIFTRLSPSACAISAALVAFAFVFAYFAVSFLRIAFSLSPALGGVCMMIGGLAGIVGGVVGGRLINRYGRKPLAIWGALFVAISDILFTFMPSAVFSVVMWTVNAFAAATTVAGSSSLSLEQVPEYRGSMMSIYASFDSSGTIVGLIVGGLVLNLYANNFHLLYIIFGVMGFAAAALLFFLAKDPCKAGSTQ